jgi:CubicO group peptidase (beta-lactamase class C family)
MVRDHSAGDRHEPAGHAAAAAAAALVDATVADGTVPGAVLVTGVGAEGPTYTHVAGRTATDGEPVAADTVFDLASLTKVTATLPVALHLADSGVLALDDPVARFLPDIALGAPAKDAVTIRQLLTHTAGLPAGRRYYLECDDASEITRRVRAEPLVAPPGTSVCYSDVGFILLGDVIGAATGAGLDALADELVFSPLGMSDTRYRPPESWRARCAATEVLAAGAAKRGVVHDENAEALGGVAGHAGVFATAGDVARVVRAWFAPEWPLVSAAARAEAVRCQTEGLGARRGLGWTLRGDAWDHMGTAWPQPGAGHTGFTGTSIGIDPVGGAWVVLLTNAVHVGRQNRAVVALRRAVHDAVATAHATATGHATAADRRTASGGRALPRPRRRPADEVSRRV